ncbi:MAG: hypothetical protein SFX18_09790 [Pirellulales bacterium]|nr:hypothetical protein [Pirellulales bacterium]
MSLKFKAAFAAFCSLWILGSTGCFWIVSQGPNLGFLSFPIPVSPYMQEEQEYRHHMHERYDRVPILGPITAGGPVQAIDPPSDDEVMRALEKARPVRGGWPYLEEKQRNNVRIVKEKFADYVDEPRFYPLLGPAQLHHAHYKCIIYFDETTRVGWPIPHTLHKPEEVEVVYIDHNHFHMVGNVDTGVGSPY